MKTCKKKLRLLFSNFLREESADKPPFVLKIEDALLAKLTSLPDKVIF